jgi:hypothetical protein
VLWRRFLSRPPCVVQRTLQHLQDKRYERRGGIGIFRAFFLAGRLNRTHDAAEGTASAGAKKIPGDSVFVIAGERLAEPCNEYYLPPPEPLELLPPDRPPPWLEPPLLPPLLPPPLPVPLLPPREVPPVPAEPLKVPPVLPLVLPLLLLLPAPPVVTLPLPSPLPPLPSGPPPFPSPVRLRSLTGVLLPVLIPVPVDEPALTLPLLPALISPLLPAVPLMVRGWLTGELGSRFCGGKGRVVGLLGLKGLLGLSAAGPVVGPRVPRAAGLVVGFIRVRVALTGSLGLVVGCVVATFPPFAPETGWFTGGGAMIMLLEAPPLSRLPPAAPPPPPLVELLVWPLD